MFEKRKDTESLITKIIAVLESKQEEGIVTHQELSHVLGLSPPESRYYSLVRRAREQFRDSVGIWSREVSGLGYRYLSPEEALVEEQQFRRRRSRNQMAIGRKAAECTRDELLTDHLRRVKIHVIESHARARRELIAEEHHEKWLLKPSSDKPLRIVPPREAGAS